MLEGDRARAYYEIAYETNKGNSKGIANRRVREARDILGDPSKLSDAEKKSLAGLLNDPEIRQKIDAYEKRFPDAFAKGGGLKSLLPKAGMQRDDRAPTKPTLKTPPSSTSTGLNRDISTP